MSDYHILDGQPNGNRYRVVMHFSVPDVNNEVGVNYRTALLQRLGGSQPSQVPFIEVAEQTQLDAGELLEYIVPDFTTHPGETLLQKQDRLDSLYSTRQTQIQENLQARLEYWGFSRDVP